jgi:4'-phosphopantetheinyl transferase
MFSPNEMNDIIHYNPPASILRYTPNLDVESKLRRFYTYFCMKEAYIKLVGEGLLADWIKECEFRNVKVPRPCSGSYVWGDKISAGQQLRSFSENNPSGVLEIWLRGKEVQNVRTEIQAFEKDFIITTMMTPSNLLDSDEEYPSWKVLHLEDILAAAEDW